MRMAYVCEDAGIPFDGSKGSSIHVRSMISAFARAEAEVVVFSPRIGDTSWARGLPVSFVRLDAHEIAAKSPPESRDEASARMADRLGAEHSSQAIDFAYERLSLWACGTSRWARRVGVPHVLEVNAPLAQEAAAHRGLLDHDGAQQAEDEVIGHAGLLLPVSPWLQRWLLAKGCRKDAVHVLPNGVEESWLSEVPTQAPPQQPIRVGFVGSLRAWHDVETAIDAIALLPEGDYVLEIVGTGPKEQELRERAGALGIANRLVWHGALAHAAVPSVIDGMDVCLAPYEPGGTNYFCPIKIFEYGARRRIVVAPDLAEFREQFPPDSLFLYKAGEPTDLARAISQAAGNHEQAAARANRLHSFARQHTWIAHARHVVASLGSGVVKASSGRQDG